MYIWLLYIICALYACVQMASVLNSEISDMPAYVVVDCRYPYEYEAGHVQASCSSCFIFDC